MAYLVIIVFLAGAGIFRLWMLQRRESKLDEVDEFWNGLERLAEPNHSVARQAPRIDRPLPRPRTGERPAPLDPDRRAAAKRRIEARRRQMRVSA